MRHLTRMLALLAVLFAGHAWALKPSDVVVVKRGEAEITLADVDAKIMQLPAEVRGGYMNDPERLDRLLNGMLLARQAAIAAEREGVTQSELIERQLKLTRDELLLNVYLQHKVDNAEVPDLDALAREDYVARPDRYQVPERRDLQHVLIKTDNRSLLDARELAQQVRAKALAGEDFDQLVAEYTEEGSPEAPSNGYIRNKAARDMVAAFSEAAFALENVGDISEVVRSRFGFHVIKLHGITPARPIPFETVKADIMRRLEAEYLNSVRQDVTVNFGAMPLEAEPEKIAALRTRYFGWGEHPPPFNAELGGPLEPAGAEPSAEGEGEAAQETTPDAG